MAIMTRRLLALVALLTGLLAFGGPAQASLAEALACGPAIAASARDDSGAGEHGVAQPVPATISATRAVEPPPAAPHDPQALRLPVLMGVERALE